MDKKIVEIGHLSTVTAVLAAICLAWQEGLVVSNTRVLILAGAGLLSVLIVLIVDRLIGQTRFMPTNLATFCTTLVVLFLLVQFGISVQTLSLYAVIAAISGGLIGLVAGKRLGMMYPALLLVTLVVLYFRGWRTLEVYDGQFWQLPGLLIFYLFTFNLLAPTLAASVAYRTSAVLVALLGVWYPPLAGIQRGDSIPAVSWVVSLLLSVLIVSLMAAPVQTWFKKMWLVPKAKRSLFFRRTQKLLQNSSEENIKVFDAVYADAPPDLRKSIYSEWIICGNEAGWGKIIQADSTQLGREALQNLSSLRATRGTPLHSSLIKIFSRGVASEREVIWRACLQKLIELDRITALHVCRRLAEKHNLSPLVGYLAVKDDAVYTDGVQALADVAKKTSNLSLTPIADVLYKELHNPSSARAAITLQVIKDSPLRELITTNLSTHFRAAGQTSTAAILKDLILIDPELLWTEADWAANEGGQRQIQELMELEDENQVAGALTRIVHQANEGQRTDELCDWLGGLLPSRSVSRSVPLLLAMALLSSSHCLQFLQKNAYRLQAEVLRSSLGSSKSPLRPMLWEWARMETTDQSEDAVKLINWIAVHERQTHESER